MISGIWVIFFAVILFIASLILIARDGFDWYYLLMILASAWGMYWGIVHIKRDKDTKGQRDKGN
jgi:hypothetical protein